MGKAKHLELVTDETFRILERFHKPEIVEDSERRSVHRLASLGYIKLRMHEGGDHKLYETASLTSLGKRMYCRQKILNNPIGRQLYRIHSILSS